jgi:Archaeal phage integrase
LPLFCPSSSAWQSEGFVMTGFRNWLTSQSKARWTIKQTLNYAIKYGHVLDSGDASSLVMLSDKNRLHAMAALASLSKFRGKYDFWMQIKQRYALKWTSSNNSMQTFQRLFSNDLDFDTLLGKIKEMIRVLPVDMGTVIKFNCLTGLRPSEAVESVRLLNTGTLPFSNSRNGPYYNAERQCLEHFRHPETFLRRTKCAYVSFVTKEQLSAIGVLDCKVPTPTYSAIRMACQHRSIQMDMRYCRKLFASWLHRCNISVEIIDLLQGRMPKSIFARHYLVLKSDFKDHVLQAIEKLKQEIE